MYRVRRASECPAEIRVKTEYDLAESFVGIHIFPLQSMEGYYQDEKESNSLSNHIGTQSDD
jgi:hypothetical protein